MCKEFFIMNEVGDTIGRIEAGKVTKEEMLLNGCDSNARSMKVFLRKNNDMVFERGIITEGACLDYSSISIKESLNIIGQMIGQDFKKCIVLEIAPIDFSLCRENVA